MVCCLLVAGLCSFGYVVARESFLRCSGGRLACGVSFAVQSGGLGARGSWGCVWYRCSGLSVALLGVVLIVVLACARLGIGSAGVGLWLGMRVWPFFRSRAPRCFRGILDVLGRFCLVLKRFGNQLGFAAEARENSG